MSSRRRVHPAAAGEAESTYAWVRLGAALLLSTIGGVGMWSVVVALPAVQAEFGVARAGTRAQPVSDCAQGDILMGRESGHGNFSISGATRICSDSRARHAGAL